MTTYADRPWLARYAPGQPSDLIPEFDTALDLFRSAVDAAADKPAIKYFDGELTFAGLDAASDALANRLVAEGFSAGDRLAIYVQNNPAFLVGLIASWKAGGASVLINPMNKARELKYLLDDSGAVALLTLDELYDEVARGVLAEGSSVRTTFTVSALDGQSRDDARLFDGVTRFTPDGTISLVEVIENHDGTRPSAVNLSPDDVAVLTYTSGTTGQPKGAMNTHRNLTFNAQTYREWIGLTSDDVVLGIAPLFHITGLVAHVMISLLLHATLVIAHRFHPAVFVEAIREHRPTFTVGAITAYIALADSGGAQDGDFTSLRALYSGGAPIAPAVADRLEGIFGAYIHNIYGLTETNSPSHGVPFGVRAPVDAESGALSVGVPVFNTVVRVIDDEGNEVPIGDVGEFATSGPQVVPGYWNKPEATATSIPGGELRTGDVGFMDADGWFYLVDRKKDMINASGYKVWPREVEDVLYGHPAIAEAAVIGVPDEYRGETVKAFVSLQPGKTATADELVEFCRERMAAYKYPRTIEIVEALPKTTTGKILRRTLRDQEVAK
ncbi:long-chain fatty acid--CoA ligase [Gordonia sp. TBRC 11910]|uniref:Long-chain fatty acid--CoA ligase n=1 Tax=Gordonia asplenii TaxID=2725283 RepID=A0A848KX77_9ACTN|nr:AMP-binding protein [Gordonia asplenii]NMO03394.1 long-chain fatty acid--CoA ligase [Gordonia asplenii]